MYGITETTVHVTYNEIAQSSIDQISNKIGKVIPDLKAYVLSSNLSALPIGGIGELYIGGVGLARGYLNNPKLTEERFIPNPFQTDLEKRNNINTRLYKTGDLVRWLEDGNLEYIGRNDFQVKIRGFRIELGEIESVLTDYSDIKQVAVLAKENKETNNKYLVAYYISDNREKLNEEDVLAYLSTKLPEYMVPTAIVHIDEFPLTLNGKLDRKALPDPLLGSNDDTYVAPRNDLETKLCNIFAGVLGLDISKVGINDDFFRLGGNSILAIKLVSKINLKYNSYLKVVDIFLYKNIKSLLHKVIQTKKHYKTIIKLNNSNNKTSMFMIHSGIGGCEVYTSLADKLANDFNCYGIDNYNLYSKKKITNLQQLAQYYLSHIEEIISQKKQKVFHLLGWSLGGQIALEIAYILEHKGYKNITVYLLDTYVKLSGISSSSNERLEKLKKQYKKELIRTGYDISYINKIISNVEITYKLSNQFISSRLKSSKILLFKAMLKYSKFVEGDVDQQEVIITKYNNIDKIIYSPTQVKVVKLFKVYHYNILEEEKVIIEEIRKIKELKKEI